MGYECDPLIGPSFEVWNGVDDVPSPQSMVTIHGASWSGSLNDAPSSVNSEPTNTNCSPPAITLGGWFGALQVIVKSACPVPPDGTVTVLELPPLTVQLVGTSVSATV